MDVITFLFLIGRILYGGYFLMSGRNHFLKMEMMSGYAASKGVPSSKLAVAVSGFLILAGGLGILTGLYVEWSVLLIAIFLVIISFKMHAYWTDADPNAKMVNMQHFLKNMALLGAALMFLAIPAPWPYAAF